MVLERTLHQRINAVQLVVEKWLSVIGGLIVMGMMLLTTADVIGRYLFNHPIDGAYELTEFMLIGMVYMGIAYIQSFRGHVRVDVFMSRAGVLGEKLLVLFGDFAGMAVFALITWRSADVALFAYTSGDYSSGLVQFPTWPSRLIVPIGTGLLTLRLLSDVIKDIEALFVSGRIELEMDEKLEAQI